MSFVEDGQEYVFNLTVSFLNNLEDVVRKYLKDVKAKVLHMKKVSSMHQDSALSQIIIYSLKLMHLPLVIMYYIYVMPFLWISRKIYIYLFVVIKIICRRSPHARRIYEHIFALFVLCKSVISKILSSKITELIAFCITTIFEIISAVLWPMEAEEEKELSMVLSVEELAELLEYEEMDMYDENDPTANNTQYPRALRGMHNYVPCNPFKATIRIHHRSVPMNHLQSKSRANTGTTDLVPMQAISRPGALTASSNSEYENCLVDYNGVDSPASFPPTPFSRAHVMNKNLDRVASTMFAARDRLRMEALSVSRDEYSRRIAKEAQSNGQFAVFDATAGIALSCGNHCAIKVGKGLCCCCRSMMPVRQDTYVYFEFSVMVSSATTPTLGIGLSPECPMNVMVGSWPCSKGLYNDGQMLVGSHWHQSTNNKKIEAGSIVGMLVYIPSAQALQQQQFQQQYQQHQQQQGLGPLLDGSALDLPDPSRLDLHYESGINKESSFFSFLGGFGHSDSSNEENFGLNLSDYSSSSSSSNVTSRNNSRACSTHVSVQNSPEKRRGKLINGGTVSGIGLSGEKSSPVAARKPPVAPSPGTDLATTTTATTTTTTTTTTSKKALFQFTINGQPVLHPPEAGWNETSDACISNSAPLYPTVSLFSEETRVWCRFCEADIIYKSRSYIGAPPGVKVYCLDGSLLLQETD